MNNHVNKTFILAIETFHSKPRNFTKFLTDKRLSFSERKLLYALLDIKANNYQVVINELNKLTVYDSDLVEGFSHVIMAIAHNNTGQFKKAIENFEIAIPLIANESNKTCAFMLYYNYFVTSSNLSDVNRMQVCVKYFISHRFQIKRQAIAKNICLFFYYSFKEEYKKCEALIKNIEENRDSLNEATWNTFLINKFNFYIRNENFPECRKVLDELKLIRTFKCKENFKFMSLLLDHIQYGHPVYAYPQDFEDVPILLYQTMLIKSLETRDDDSTLLYWMKLQELYPDQYKKDFEYVGPKCLFSLALEKHQNRSTTNEIKVDELTQKNKVDQLYTILQQRKAPIHSGEIYELLYQSPYNQEKENARKVQIIISKVKQKFKVEISFQRGHYQLMKNMSHSDEVA